jgi:hypothetical protein
VPHHAGRGGGTLDAPHDERMDAPQREKGRQEETVVKTRLFKNGADLAAWIAGVKESAVAREVRGMIELPADEAARDLIGDQGQFIMKHDAPAGDGRQRYGIYGPDGALLTLAWGKDEAERKVKEIIAAGMIRK